MCSGGIAFRVAKLQMKLGKAEGIGEERKRWERKGREDIEVEKREAEDRRRQGRESIVLPVDWG